MNDFSNQEETMSVIFKLAKTIIVIGLSLGALAACGGGGGGADSGSGFTGVQTQAVIDDSNAQQLVIDAYAGGSLTDSLVVPLNLGGGRNQALVPLGKALVSSLPEFNFVPTVTPLATQTNMVSGSCGGSATATVTDNGNSVSGNIAYNNFCEANVTLNGSVSFSGSFNDQTNIASMSMSFGSLTTAEGSLSGSVSMSFNLLDSAAPMSMGMNVILTDAQTRTYWIENYTMVITSGVSFDTVQFSGIYHDFDAGHVIINTSSPLQVDSFTGIPEAGTLNFAGANGTFADLTATGGGTYTLTVSTGTVINGNF